MKKAFTLIEILTVVAILCIVAGITYPIFASAKKASKRTACISNLRQIGTGMAIYRTDNDGLEQGTPTQMGLPQDLGFLGSAMWSLRCHGDDPKENEYIFNYPSARQTEIAQKQWASYTNSVGPNAILIFDPNHQTSYPRSLHWEKWTVLGLRLDGSVIIRTHMGFPLSLRWWHF